LKRQVVVLLTCIALLAWFAPVLVVAQGSTSNGYAQPEWLVDPAWLSQRLDDEQITVVALTPADEFATSHIPGAVQVDWPDLALAESAQLDDWRMQIESLLTDLGIERAETVVIYDGGTLYAPRLWWILVQLGHEDVRLLNGGFPAWTAAGEPVESGASNPQPAAVPYIGMPDESAIATVDEVVLALDDPSTVLVDARSADEFAAGHIPSAVSFPFTDVAGPDQPRYWKPADQLRAELEALGITPDKHIIPYCSSGVRSAALYFTLRLLGYDNVSLFTGSYDEWTADPTRPIET
jgi:thiosulfate/3-mercaptopyruvate sulfurtransferase